MLTVLSGSRSELPDQLESELAAYRFEVFIQELQWQLPVENGCERDQFDRADTRYVIVRNDANAICGCARLLPTTGTYLLGEIFPQLLGGVPPPHAPDLWELSRFATRSVPLTRLGRDEARERFRRLFMAIVETSVSQGVRRLITFTAVGVERILRNLGLHAHRAGSPQLIDGKPVLALWIELDEQTHRALDLPFRRGQSS